VPMMVAEFNRVGLGQWFRYFTAFVEIAGGILLLWPGRAVYGALLLVGVCAGALLAQLFAIHQDLVHTIVIGGIPAAIAWAHHGQLSKI